MDENPLKGLKAPWITKDGEIIFGKLPIDSPMERTLHPDFEIFRQACTVLKTMHLHGKTGAAIYLLGLLHHYRNDFARLSEVVDSLYGYKTQECAEALFLELRRVKSSNTTRRYIDTLLKALSFFPLNMVENGLNDLANDKMYTYKMRAKFKSLINRSH